MNIKYYKHKDIDKFMWDNAIANSHNKTIYSYYWYLSIVCPNWDALIYGNYELIMPLTIRRKYGIKYLFQPFFTQQLGIFSKTEISLNIINKFLDIIKKKFILIEINLNEKNIVKNKKYINLLDNQRINIRSEYEKIVLKYSKSNIKNIKKAKRSGVFIKKYANSHDFVNFMKKNLKKQIGVLKDKDFDTLQHIIEYSLKNSFGVIYNAYYNHNEICTMAFFLIVDNIAILIANSSNIIGKQKRAMFLLVDTFIKEHHNKIYELDFAGSNMPGVAYFNEGFGAIKIKYPNIMINKVFDIFIVS